MGRGNFLEGQEITCQRATALDVGVHGLGAVKVLATVGVLVGERHAGGLLRPVT